MKYVDSFVKSFKNLRLALFVPSLLMALVSFVFGFLFVKFSGVADFISNPDFVAGDYSVQFPMLMDFLSNNWFELVLYGVIFFVINFVVGSGFIALKYMFMKKAYANKRIKIVESLRKGAEGFFWKVISFRFFVYLISVLVLLFVAFVFLAFRYFGYEEIGFTFSSVLFFIALFLVAIYLFFSFQIMFLENRGALGTIKKSFDYSRKNFLYVFVFWLVIFVVGAASGSLGGAFNFLNQAFVSYFWTIYALNIILRTFISIFLDVWMDFMKFYAYKGK